MSFNIVTLEQWESVGLTYDQLRWQIRNGNIIADRACKDKPLTIKLDSVPDKYKSKLVNAVKPQENDHGIEILVNAIQRDEKALSFYSNYKLADGRNLEDKYIQEYTLNAEVLNALIDIKTTQERAMKALGKKPKNFLNQAAASLLNAQDKLGHTLPCANRQGEPNSVVLKRKLDAYMSEGYGALISKKFCNDNTRKVTSDIERLIMSIYTMKNKPFAADVHVIYLSFIAGKTQIADSKTGELFDPKDFFKDGEPIQISESTVWRYLNMPHNRAVVDSRRNSSHSYNNMHRPHHHRNAPKFSFSKVSMDDRDLPRKLMNGTRVKAYYAYDVQSGCVVGASYSRSKDEALFIECLRDMFRTIHTNELPMPMEVEVENHLVNKFFDDLHLMFPFVRICNPGNSQEKSAEHFNRAKKYKNEKSAQTGIGRWWARHEAYRVDQDKIDDQFVEKEFTYERLVADDQRACESYNNSLHPQQKTYPGKTRWEVMMENLNPSAPQVSNALVYKSIGEVTHTSIRRNQYVTVQNEKYILPSVEVLKRLQANDLKVTAYYMSDSQGKINEVYLYQGATYICKCDFISKYNRARAEWEENDNVAYIDQSRYVASFDKFIKEGKNKLASPEIIEELDYSAAPVVIDTTYAEVERTDYLDDFDPEEYKNKAYNDI